jgi:hypothetical protein
MHLILNVLPFSHPEEERTFGLFKEKKEGLIPVHRWEFPKPLWEKQAEEVKLFQYLYTDLTENPAADFHATFKFSESYRFADHYYRHKIYKHFLKEADVVEMGFVNDITVWFHDKSINNADFFSYKKYTLRVQYGKVSQGMELALSYDGMSLVYKKNLAQLDNVPPEKINRVIYNKEIYSYQKNSELVKHDLPNVYPILSKPLSDTLAIERPTKREPNKYIPYLAEINYFYETYLNQSDFKNIIHIGDAFVKLEDTAIHKTKYTSNELLFGKDRNGNYQKSVEPKKDFLRLGPHAPSKSPNVRFIFVYHKADKEKYVKQLFSIFRKGLADAYVPFPPIQDAIKQNVFLEQSKGFEFSSVDTAIQEIQQQLVPFQKVPNTQYVAIYISPIKKDEKDADRLALYFRIKELLLNQDITSQVVFKESLFHKDLKWYLPNIAVALLAKINGVPWRLDRPNQKDLVVGVGAFYSLTNRTKYIGSTFCFNNDGTFQGFSCIPATQTDLLAAEISKAIMKYVVDNHDKAERLIIHFYKKISEDELKPIMDVLHTFNWNIPVIVITINKTLSNDYVAFDMDNAHRMPVSGTIIPIGRNQYLLYNNTRYNEADKVSDYPFPVKLTFSSQTPEILNDVLTIKDLIDGVYQFSRMYWKSVKQQNLPVTIKYPEMAAEIFSHFDGPGLPPFGTKNLWFL